MRDAWHDFPCDDPTHDRCVRARADNWTCRAGHPLDTSGLCALCDAVPLPLSVVLRALLRAGGAPKRRPSR